MKKTIKIIMSLMFSFLIIFPTTTMASEDRVLENELIVLTEFIINTEEYCSEQAVDFYGVPVLKIKSLFDDSSEESIQNWIDRVGNIFVYHVFVDSAQLDGHKAKEILQNKDGIISISVNDGGDVKDDEPQEVGLIGDVNADESVDAFDCLIVKGIYFDSYDATEDELSRADINSDGEIDMFDYLEVKSIYFEQ